MLQFWKKPGNKDRCDTPASSPSKIINCSATIGADNVDIQRGPLTDFKNAADEKELVQQSRLSLNLTDAFADGPALASFSQFLQSRGCSLLLGLWSDVRRIHSGSGDDLVPDPLSLREESASLTGVERRTEAIAKTSRRARSISESESVRTAANGSWLARLWQRYLSEELTHRIKIPDELLHEVLSVMTSHGDASSHDRLIRSLQDQVFRMMIELWKAYEDSEWHCKYQVELLTSGSVTLSDILYHDSALAAFMEYMEQEECQVVGEFWLAANNFERQIASSGDCYDPGQALSDAIVIYDKYLSLQATSPLGVSGSMRSLVEQAICNDESTGPRQDCFASVALVTMAFMRTRCLRGFLSSQHYVQLLSEVMRTAARPPNSSPGSSISEVTVDTRQGCDQPDRLWMRRHHRFYRGALEQVRDAIKYSEDMYKRLVTDWLLTIGRISAMRPLVVDAQGMNDGLSLGRIDQLGRFETDIEPEPDRKSESRISRVVKRLVNRDEAKAQEEMAWRVAEMIVKDVTNVTMGGHIDSEEDIGDEEEGS